MRFYYNLIFVFALISTGKSDEVDQSPRHILKSIDESEFTQSITLLDGNGEGVCIEYEL